MSADEMFRAFRNDPYAAEARERWPEVAPAVQEEVAGWDPEEAGEVQAEMGAVHQRLAELMAAGEPIDGPAVQDAVAAHHRFVSRFWAPNREAYTNLGAMYVDDARFTATIDAYGEGLSVYLHDAMTTYAQSHLE